MKIENQPQMTPEQIVADEVEIKKIRERNLATRAAEAAKEKINEANNTHDFMSGLSTADDKALGRKKQIETLRREISEM